MEPRGAEEDLEEHPSGWGALFDNDDDGDDDYAPSECDSDRLSDVSEWDPVEAALEDSAPPIYLYNTQSIRGRLSHSISVSGRTVLDRVKSILAYIEGSGSSHVQYIRTSKTA
ncbi:hypothetical protein BD310DRAFT_883844 [Dichomitus squalens]|uniref:Uncharacterized protein n=1 Tax=Dichomitus squalens TaxID=114155 RepID=A0A4Q9PN95_9APHY|nr:hypothetical protein BD310DRAFT_883844 [Dichomitus squalens]